MNYFIQEQPKLVNNSEQKDLFISKLNQVIKQQVNAQQQPLRSIKKDETKN